MEQISLLAKDTSTPHLQAVLLALGQWPWATAHTMAVLFILDEQKGKLWLPWLTDTSAGHGLGIKAVRCTGLIENKQRKRWAKGFDSWRFVISQRRRLPPPDVYPACLVDATSPTTEAPKEKVSFSAVALQSLAQPFNPPTTSVYVNTTRHKLLLRTGCRRCYGDPLWTGKSDSWRQQLPKISPVPGQTATFSRSDFEKLYPLFTAILKFK